MSRSDKVHGERVDSSPTCGARGWNARTTKNPDEITCVRCRTDARPTPPRRIRDPLAPLGSK